MYVGGDCYGSNGDASLSCPLFINVEKTQIRSAKRWKWITTLINKSETTVMVSHLIPHRSSNILLCSYFCPPSVNYFIVFVFLSIFRWLFYCVLIPVRLPSIPHIILLLKTFLVPSLIVGYRPTLISHILRLTSKILHHASYITHGQKSKGGSRGSGDKEEGIMSKITWTHVMCTSSV